MDFQQSKHIDFSIWILLMACSMASLNMFVYCFFGKMATESFEQMANSLYEINWPELPIRLQKYIILMIGNAQRPIYYHGFGMAVLNLETFGKVKFSCFEWIEHRTIYCALIFLQLIKTVFTIYMMFKTLSTNQKE